MKSRCRAEAKDITTLNRENSPLLRLPGELRNRIYEYALCQDWRMKLNANPFRNDSLRIHKHYFEDLQRVLQTTGACKQMHKEMALLYFKFGTFIVNGSPYAFVNQWLIHRSLPQQQAITRLVFPCTYELSYSVRESWMRGNFRGADFRPRDVTNLKLPIVLPGLRKITISIDVRTPERHIGNGTMPRLSILQLEEWTAYDIEVFKEACLGVAVAIKYQFCRALYYMA
ncbi:unnamed protein product [Alternaria burnsii]|nr:unnamed protein product [Alternaria burnsii]